MEAAHSWKSQKVVLIILALSLPSCGHRAHIQWQFVTTLTLSGMALQQLEFVMPPYKSWGKCDPIEHYHTQPEMSRISRIYLIWLIYPSRDPNRVLYRFFVLVGGKGVGPKWGLSYPACLLLSQERSGGWITHRMEPSLLQGYNPTICLGLGWHWWFCSQFNPIEEERGWYSSQPSPWIQGYNPTICLSDICDFAFHPIWSQFNPFKESKRGDNTQWVLIIAGLSMDPGVECHHFDPCIFWPIWYHPTSIFQPTSISPS